MRRRSSWFCWTSTNAGRATPSSCASSSPTRARHCGGSTSTVTATATAMSSTSGATRRRDSRTNAGRTPGIRFADGTIAKGPIATCEIQGYVYDAKGRTARLAREIWDDDELADRLEREAEELKQRFNEDFWLSQRECYALALDGEKRTVDSITSNIGHLLWSGIVDDARAERVAEHLVGPALFSGWGVRTMAEGEGGYNPIRYHNGTVWPHDNSLIALGLSRYGYREEAARIAQAVLEAATYFHYRLPEVFAGYRRGRTSFPVEYPTASSPQAWATGTPLAFLRVLLWLEPEDDELTSDPWLPDRIGRIELRDIPGRWGHTNATTLKEVVR